MKWNVFLFLLFDGEEEEEEGTVMVMSGGDIGYDVFDEDGRRSCWWSLPWLRHFDSLCSGAARKSIPINCQTSYQERWLKGARSWCHSCDTGQCEPVCRPLS
jgi:hypothetical protein